MECNVYDTALARVGAVYTWISMVWEESYNSEGSFALEMQLEEGLAELFRPGRYCGMPGKDTLMLIQSVMIRENTVLVGGVPAAELLKHRVVTESILGKNTEAALLGLVGKMAPWENVTAGEASGLTGTVTAEPDGGTVWDYCQTATEAADMGFGLFFDREQRKLVFRCYRPGEDANQKYSSRYGNAGNVSFSVSEAGYKNVAAVRGEYITGTPVTVYTGNTELSGSARREMYLKGESQTTEESMDAYQARLAAMGEAKLLEQIRVKSLTFDIDDEKIPLGGMVRCDFPELNLRAKVRIIGVTETSEQNGTVRTARLGTPVIMRRR